jgi:hypothetical protein
MSIARTVSSSALATLAGAALTLTAGHAQAYRPFDGTDAGVAPPKLVELELGPAGYYQRGSRRFLIAPAVTLNLGLFANTELVMAGQQYIAVGTAEADTARINLRGTELLLKHVFVEGTLQGATGVSFAAEGGLLAPELPDDGHVGASLNLITSYSFRWAAFHWDEWFQLTRERHADLFSGLILEGPGAWQLRPVAELFYERDFGGEQTGSVLLGAIWVARAALALDGGLRGARQGNDYAAEARLGLTWAWGL